VDRLARVVWRYLLCLNEGARGALVKVAVDGSDAFHDWFGTCIPAMRFWPRPGRLAETTQDARHLACPPLRKRMNGLYPLS
jgi:hypothetical protein